MSVKKTSRNKTDNLSKNQNEDPMVDRIGEVVNHIMDNKLTAIDKAKIIDLVISDASSEEILNCINKESSLIEEFIDKLKNKFAEKKEEIKEGIKEEIISKVISMLSQSGLSLDSITRKINSVISKFEKKDLQILSVEDLYALCLQQINASDTIITKTAGGQSGVAIMTDVASQQSDKSKTKTKPPVPYIYKIK